MADSLTRFIFENLDVRGELIQLNESVHELLDGHDYPVVLAELLKQAAAINALLASTLKFEGRITLQLQTPGAMKFLLVQTSHELQFRGTISFDAEADYANVDFRQLTANGQLVITIEPINGERYQGVVALEADNLAGCIENYFAQSEQLRTRIWLFSNAEQECGLLLQALPAMQEASEFEHLTMLAETITGEELFTLSSEAILYRLFHEETLRIFESDNVQFHCDCSRDKMLSSVSMLSADDLDEIFAEQDMINVQCQFCGDEYNFEELDLKQVHAVQGNQTQH